MHGIQVCMRQKSYVHLPDSHLTWRPSSITSANLITLNARLSFWMKAINSGLWSQALSAVKSCLPESYFSRFYRFIIGRRNTHICMSSIPVKMHFSERWTFVVTQWPQLWSKVKFVAKAGRENTKCSRCFYLCAWYVWRLCVSLSMERLQWMWKPER